MLCYDYGINGRLLCNITAILSIMAGEAVFNVVNTIMFVLVIALIVKSVPVSSPSKKPLLTIITLWGLLILSTGADSLYYWASGSSNYLWAFLYNIIFMTLLHRYRCEGVGGVWKNILLSVLSFVLALNNEMFVCPISAMLLCYYLLKRSALNSTLRCMIVFYVLGTAVVVCAPGNFARETVYTVGLGYFSRIVKIAYGLRVSYVMLFMLVAYVLRNRFGALLFIKRNLLLFGIFGLSFVVPFLAASTGRSLYGIEIWALLIILRLVNEWAVPRWCNTTMTVCMSVALLAFQGSVLYDSVVKWRIVSGTLEQYYKQDGAQVYIDDYQSACGLTEYYTVDIDNILMPCDKANQYALEKMRKKGEKTVSEYADSLSYIKILPYDVSKAISSRSMFFKPENHIGMGLYHSKELMYSVMRYDSLKLDSMTHGHLFALYHVRGFDGVKVKINYLENDIDFERAAYSVDTPYGKFVLLKRKYKRYPMLDLEYFGLNKKTADSKIELYVDR